MDVGVPSPNFRGGGLTNYFLCEYNTSIEITTSYKMDQDPWPPNLPTSQPMIDSQLFELDRNSMLKELFEFGGSGIVGDGVKYGNGNISSTQPISPENSENYLISILKEATSCPNTSGVEWRTVLKDVKDFIVTCEGYLKLIVAIIGLIFTSFYLIVILCRPRKLTSYMQGMMAQLFVIECFAMLVDITFSAMIIDEAPHCGSYAYAVLIAHVIHPLENMLTYSSILMMIVIAEQQVKILRSPVAQQDWLKHKSCFKRTFSVTKYVYMIALIIAVPRAGESKVVDSRDDEVEMFLHPYESHQVYCPVFNDHRFLVSYAVVYRTCVIFIPTLFVPLLYLSYNVYRMNWMLKRRSEMENRPKQQSEATKTIKRSTAKMCRAFTALIILLLVCYSPSFFYGLYQSIHNHELDGGRNLGCSAAPIWVHKLKSLCELSTTVYSSLCGIVYCSICPHFRHKAQFILSKFIPFLKPTIPRLMSSASLDPNMVEREQLSLHLIRNPSIVIPPSTNIVPNIIVNDV